jgi:hypothetical protein
MTISDRRLRHAIRLTPKDERARYAEEWNRDLLEAGAGESSPGIVRGAVKVALRRRARWAGGALLGGRGIGTAVLLWVALVVVIALELLIGGPFGVVLLSVLLLAVVSLMSAGRSSVLRHWLLLGSASVGLSAAGYCWWVLGVQIEAADAFSPVPEAARYGGVGLIALSLSIVVFVVSAIVGYVRKAH